MSLDKNTIHHESILLVNNFEGGNIWNFAKNIDTNFKNLLSKNSQLNLTKMILVIYFC